MGFRHLTTLVIIAAVTTGCSVPTDSAINDRTTTPLFTLSSTAISSVSVDFENPLYVPGVIHLQDGWSSSGAAGSGCAKYDHEVVTNTGAPFSFGTQSLRISNAVTSGCFGDQTFSKELPTGAGETSAEDILGSTTSPRSTRFEAQWKFASTIPSSEQPGLSVVASPDRGDGARMSWIQMTDTPSGIEVNFFDYQRAHADFVLTKVVGGLDRGTPHDIRIVMDFLEGPANDVVKVFVDGVLVHTGTSWEDFFRDVEKKPTRTVSRILFRTAGTPAPATAGNGFVIDNLSLTASSTPPSTNDQCKHSGWQAFNNPVFKNQGDCIQFVNTGK